MATATTIPLQPQDTISPAMRPTSALTQSSTPTTTTNETTHSSKDTKTSLNNNNNDSNTSTTLLTTKIINALKTQGHNRESCEKVAGIVTRNVLSRHSHSYSHSVINNDNNNNNDGDYDGDGDGGDSPRNKSSLNSSLSTDGTVNVQNTIQRMLSHILGQDTAGQVKVNSNEPVLLIMLDCAARRSYGEVMELKGRCLDVLRWEWGVWPVRVFIGDSSSSPSSSTTRTRKVGCTTSLRDQDGEENEEEISYGFSVTVLNVVNTEVGANMIQLLDEDESGPSEWCDVIVGKEAWNRSECLWGVWHPRHSSREAERTQIDQESGAFLQHNEPHPVLMKAQPDQVTEIGALDSSRILPDTDVRQDESTEPSSKEDEVPKDTNEDEDEATTPPEHPAMAEWRERERQRGHVNHPTWEIRGASDSLYDMIKMQASQVSVVDEGIDQDDNNPES